MREQLSKYKILIEPDDNDFIRPCKKFIEDLEHEYNVFQNELKENEIKWML